MAMRNEEVSTGFSDNASMVSGSTWQVEGGESYSVPGSVAGSAAGSEAGDVPLHAQDEVADANRLLAVPEGEVVQEKDWTARQREYFTRPVHKCPSPPIAIGAHKRGEC